MSEQEIIPSQQTLSTIVGEEVVTRRLHGVQQLCNFLNHKIPVGQSVHVLTGGNCDLLSQLLWITRVYGKISKLFITVWVASMPDLHILERYIKSGIVAPSVRFLFGDIYPSQYKKEYAKVLEMYKNGYVDDVYVLNTHAKIMLIECASGEKITIEASANLNLNPRVEMAAIHTSPELYDFYDYYLNEIMREQKDKYAIRSAIKRMIKNGEKTEISDAERSAFVWQD